MCRKAGSPLFSPVPVGEECLMYSHPTILGSTCSLEKTGHVRHGVGTYALHRWGWTLNMKP